MRDQAAWEIERLAESDQKVFRGEILPGIQNVSLGMLARRTGQSRQYCSVIRRGMFVPHSRYWQALRAINSPDAGENAQNE